MGESGERKFFVSIPSTKKKEGVVYYVIRTLVSVADETDPAGSVTLEGSTEARFRELDSLKKALVKAFGSDNLPVTSFPQKGFKFFENHNDLRFIKKRISGLEAWFKELETVDGVYENEGLLSFLGVDRML